MKKRMHSTDAFDLRDAQIYRLIFVSLLLRDNSSSDMQLSQPESTAEFLVLRYWVFAAHFVCVDANALKSYMRVRSL